MLARLFDSIRLQALIAALFIIVLICIFWGLFVGHSESQLHLPGLVLQISPLWFKGLFAVVLILMSFWFNAILNSGDAFKTDYHLTILLALQVPAIAFLEAKPELLLALPLIVLSFKRMLDLARSKGSLHILFDIGAISAVASLLYPQALLLIILSWLAAVSFGQIEVKSFLSSLLGLAATYFLIFAGFYFISEIDFISFMLNRLSEILISFDIGKLSLLGIYVPIVISLLLGIPDFLSAVNKAKVLKRQVLIFFALTFLVTLFIGTIINTKTEIFVLIVFPLVVFQANLLRYLKKWWLQDLYYLLVI